MKVENTLFFLFQHCFIDSLCLYLSDGLALLLWFVHKIICFRLFTKSTHLSVLEYQFNQSLITIPNKSTGFSSHGFILTFETYFVVPLYCLSTVLMKRCFAKFLQQIQLSQKSNENKLQTILKVNIECFCDSYSQMFLVYNINYFFLIWLGGFLYYFQL